MSVSTIFRVCGTTRQKDLRVFPQVINPLLTFSSQKNKKIDLISIGIADGYSGIVNDVRILGMASTSRPSDLPACRYGRDCFRINPLHLDQFSHPPGHIPGMKRAQQEDDSSAASPKRSKPTPAQGSDAPSVDVQAQCRLEGFHLVKVAGLSPKHNANALSLSDILAAVRPTSSIHFNFMIDIDWLLRQYPSGCSQQITLVVGESGGTDYAQVLRDARNLPSSSINVKVARARMFLPYGSHHTKMSLFKSASGLHALISTANLIERDWGQKTQGLFICLAPPNNVNDVAKKTDEFRSDLLQYLGAYSRSSEWPLIKEWYDLIEAHDFSAVRARLVGSVPGYHKDGDKDKWGHLRLRTLLRSVERDKKCQVVAEFSSIGSLGAKPETWVNGQFLRSLLGGQPTDTCRVNLVYPTVTNVRNSLEGYLAGGSLPYASKTAIRQPWLLSLLHQWKSEQHGRTNAMPHMKSYALVTPDEKLRWLLLTSANLSKAAWGELQKNETQLMIRSYELGVLLMDGEQTGMDIRMLPFDWPLTKYGGDDRPWVVDERHNVPDVYGRTWPPD